jgi:hypothetical protein
MVSMVKSLFHCARHGSLVASTWKLSAQVSRRLNTKYLSVLSVYTGQVDLGCELDLGRLIGVIRAAMDGDAVDAVLVDALICLISV